MPGGWYCHWECQLGSQSEHLHLASPHGYWTFSLWLGFKNEYPTQRKSDRYNIAFMTITEITVSIIFVIIISTPKFKKRRHRPHFVVRKKKVSKSQCKKGRWGGRYCKKMFLNTVHQSYVTHKAVARMKWNNVSENVF